MYVVKKNDPLYPEKLRVYSRMPDPVYVLGELPDPSLPSVSIIGSRNCSAYGKKEALRFGRILAQNGVQVISGMARGIDSWAHIGALEGGGKTFAILGSGVDVCYPVSHEKLYNRILSCGGGIISEFCPGTPALPHHFPLRNRIISALCDVLLVVEARKRSGSLITVSYALEQGKTIFAVPGKNEDALSEGCNRLLSDGALFAWGPEAILQELGIIAKHTETAEAGSGNTKTSETGIAINRIGKQEQARTGNIKAGNSGTEYAENGSVETECAETESAETESAETGSTETESGKPGTEKHLPESLRQTPHACMIYSLLGQTEKSIDQILAETGLSMQQTAPALVRLCLEGYAEEVPGKRYIRRNFLM